MNGVNTEAMRERQGNKAHIKEHDLGGGVKGLDIDTRKVAYQGRKWVDLSGTQKRRFENALVLSEPKQRLRFHYS